MSAIVGDATSRFSLRSVLDPATGVLIWFVAAALFFLFAVTAPGFATPFNMTTILSEGTLVALVAVGLTPVIISGNIDISVGSMLGLSACLSIALQPYGLVTGVVAALGVGALAGLFNGIMTEKLGINSFIVTLAAMTAIRGLTFVIVGEHSVTATDPRFLAIGNSVVGLFPTRAIVMLLIALAIAWMLRNTSHGRYTFAVGGNRKAAVDAGVRVSRVVILNMALAGLLAAVAGVAMASQLGAITPSFGAGYELWAITSVVLGGTRLRGGVGSILGTLGAVMALTILRNGMVLLQVPPLYMPIVTGAALIIALAADRRSIGTPRSGE